MVERPYQYVPTTAILILIVEYKKIVDAGDFKKTNDLELMKEELDFRFCSKLSEKNKKQISIEEYMRERKKNERE